MSAPNEGKTNQTFLCTENKWGSFTASFRNYFSISNAFIILFSVYTALTSQNKTKTVIVRYPVSVPRFVLLIYCTCTCHLITHRIVKQGITYHVQTNNYDIPMIPGCALW